MVLVSSFALKLVVALLGFSRLGYRMIRRREQDLGIAGGGDVEVIGYVLVVEVDRLCVRDHDPEVEED